MAKTLRTDESIVINRPLPEVFQYMTDPAHAMEWGTNVTDYKMLSGAPDEVGALASIDVRVAGAKVHATEEVTAFERNKKIGLKSKDSRVEYERELDFDSGGDGATRVSFHMGAEPNTGLFKFADAVALKLYSRDIRSNLENAKTILETPNG
ncbi:hypothetical protein EGT67_18990 [Prescottella agglutinans]|uniref:Polyketide cyclase n=1 Tax=Prescottella agglutinans TaxID=1644129 RepID=A0A3S3ATE9_9NOCA|nr:SRPBCC family protein [Prescottella agglutinans]RVW08012.1 hypothetical protein EGT67_18990 [Prescottella agglutinans]